MAQKEFVIKASDPKGQPFEDVVSANHYGQAKDLFECKYNGKCRIRACEEKKCSK